MISIVIPTYEEEKNIGELIEEIASQVTERDLEIIVVDDGSRDGTQEVVMSKKEKFDYVDLIVREDSRGIGSAYKRAFREAEGDIIVQMDADFSHPPKKISDLVETVEAGKDVAVGSRYVDQGTRNDPLHRRINPLIGSYLYRYMLGSPVRDVTSGFKAYSREAAEEIIDQSENLPEGFHFQAASLMHLIEEDYSAVEVPIDFMPRRAGEPKYQFTDLLKNVRLLLQLGVEKHLG